MAKTAANEEEARAVMTAIRQIVRVLREASRAAEKDVGVSGAQLFVLHKLEDREALSLNELADLTLTHQSSVSVVVQKLVERGLVKRARAASDARRLELSLTEQGKQVLGRSPRAAQDRIIDALHQLEPAARRELARTLTQLVGAMGVTDTEPPMIFEEPSGPARAGAAKKLVRRTARH